MATEAIIDTSHADGSAEKAFLGQSKEKAIHGGRKNGQQDNRGKKRKLKEPSTSEGSHDEVLSADVRSLLAKLDLADKADAKRLERFEEVEVIIDEVSSTGDGLGHVEGSDKVFVVPFTAAGDVVKAKYIREDSNTNTMICDLIKVVTPSPQRDDKLITCPYFAKCSGCQFQMLPYSAQLAHKKTIVEKAYKNFSGLPAEVLPVIGDTMGSPLQYGYRTKLTPHFDGPPGGRRAGRRGERPRFEEVPPIGFMQKGTRKTLDIEECPIATEAVQMGLRRERKRVTKEIDKYTRGATILLRESTERTAKHADDQAEITIGVDEDKQIVYEDRGSHIHAKSCITDNHATTTEYIDDFVFENNANSFFQNNNSILPSFTQYIRDQIMALAPAQSAPSASTATTETETSPASSASPKPFTNLIDAYSGSGLFTITLSSLFLRSVGIDIDLSGIQYAKRNARLNSLVPLVRPVPTDADQPPHAVDNADTKAEKDARVSFIAATASELFVSVKSWNPDETVVVCDPPRKGCDESFLRQLLEFGPRVVVYVSCNVHTQARDIGFLLRNGEGPGLGEGVGGVGKGMMEEGKVIEGWEKAKYEVVSLRGFDFFPQTGHVEGVAVLRRRD